MRGGEFGAAGAHDYRNHKVYKRNIVTVRVHFGPTWAHMGSPGPGPVTPRRCNHVEKRHCLKFALFFIVPLILLYANMKLGEFVKAFFHKIRVK